MDNWRTNSLQQAIFSPRLVVWGGELRYEFQHQTLEQFGTSYEDPFIQETGDASFIAKLKHLPWFRAFMDYARSENGASITALVHDDAFGRVLFHVGVSQLTDTYSRHGRIQRSCWVVGASGKVRQQTHADYLHLAKRPIPVFVDGYQISNASLSTDRSGRILEKYLSASRYFFRFEDFETVEYKSFPKNDIKNNDIITLSYHILLNALVPQPSIAIGLNVDPENAHQDMIDTFWRVLAVLPEQILNQCEALVFVSGAARPLNAPLSHTITLYGNPRFEVAYSTPVDGLATISASVYGDLLKVWQGRDGLFNNLKRAIDQTIRQAPLMHVRGTLAAVLCREVLDRERNNTFLVMNAFFSLWAEKAGDLDGFSREVASILYEKVNTFSARRELLRQFLVDRSELNNLAVRQDTEETILDLKKRFVDFLSSLGFLSVSDVLFNWNQLEIANTPVSDITVSQSRGQSEYQRLDVLRSTSEFRPQPKRTSLAVWRTATLVLALICTVLVFALFQRLSAQTELQSTHDSEIDELNTAYNQLEAVATRSASDFAMSDSSSARQRATLQAGLTEGATLIRELEETQQAQAIALTEAAVQVQSLSLSEANLVATSEALQSTIAAQSTQLAVSPEPSVDPTQASVCNVRMDIEVSRIYDSPDIQGTFIEGIANRDAGVIIGAVYVSSGIGDNPPIWWRVSFLATDGAVLNGWLRWDQGIVSGDCRQIAGWTQESDGTVGETTTPFSLQFNVRSQLRFRGNLILQFSVPQSGSLILICPNCSGNLQSQSSPNDSVIEIGSNANISLTTGTHNLQMSTDRDYVNFELYIGDN
jgi:hypothetical protein